MYSHFVRAFSSRRRLTTANTSAPAASSSAVSRVKSLAQNTGALRFPAASITGHPHPSQGRITHWLRGRYAKKPSGRISSGAASRSPRFQLPIFPSSLFHA